MLADSNDASSTLPGVFGTTSGYVTIHTHSTGTPDTDAIGADDGPDAMPPPAKPNAPTT